jgi:hypothetical protein
MKRYLILLVMLSALCTLALGSCLGSIAPAAATNTGSLQLSIANASGGSAKTVQPTANLAATSFEIYGSGPDNHAFSDEVTSTQYSRAALPIGAWIIKIYGKDDSGEKILSGIATAVIAEGATTSVAITLVPMDGTGTLAINLSWPLGSVAAPSIVSTLTPIGGTGESLSFTMADNSASYGSSSLASGYYTLSIKLMDGDTAVWGGIEEVRILANKTTSMTKALAKAEMNCVITGSLGMTVTIDYQDPVDISLSGGLASLPLGQSMTVTATCSITPTAYAWYLNGTLIDGQASSSIAIGSGLDMGNYRLDAIAYAEDRTGSASLAFSVTDSPIPQLIDPDYAGNTYAGVVKANGDAVYSRNYQYVVMRNLKTMNAPFLSLQDNGTPEAIDASNGREDVFFVNDRGAWNFAKLSMTYGTSYTTSDLGLNLPIPMRTLRGTAFLDGRLFYNEWGSGNDHMGYLDANNGYAEVYVTSRASSTRNHLMAFNGRLLYLQYIDSSHQSIYSVPDDGSKNFANPSLFMSVGDFLVYYAVDLSDGTIAIDSRTDGVYTLALYDGTTKEKIYTIDQDSYSHNTVFNSNGYVLYTKNSKAYFAQK